MYEREYNEKDLNEIIDKGMYDCYSMCGIW
jgi:hypothetical protein